MSRSEAGQRKHLLVLDSNWQRTDAIFLDLGPRFHAMTGAEPVLPQDLRPGDRLAGLPCFLQPGLVAGNMSAKIVCMHGLVKEQACGAG